MINTAFQFEIRFTKILDFSEISRSLLAPFVKLASDVSVDKQNSTEEMTILKFDEDNYLIMVSWDRLVLRGQGEIKTFVKKKSYVEIPFLKILDRIKSIEGFGNIKSFLFATTYVAKLDTSLDNLPKLFKSKIFNDDLEDISSEFSDYAIVMLEKKESGDLTEIRFGPYLNPTDIMNRTIVPLNINRLGDIEFTGVIFEYKNFLKSNEINLDNFSKEEEKSTKIFSDLCKKLRKK
ncbi:hypothetical protein [Psychroserpens mesophilus]|uniref:hypothetical protein n=1 Tax=Psychroserpens mesophilus TaxID=325473 RepID=UPI00058BA827|nr:hypothetical protein [Psychroserpens mesophilus]